MNHRVKILAYKPEEDTTYLQIKVNANLTNILTKYKGDKGLFGELRIDDGRTISSEQRGALYATFRDIAEWNGDPPEYIKEFLKFSFCAESGQEYFSLSDCSVSTAWHFTNHVIEFVIKHGVPLEGRAIERTQDIDRYLFFCLKYKRCCICGRDGELHHWDAIGAGNNRDKIDDSKHRKMCICREHHSEAHNIGVVDFASKYKVYGIIYNEEEVSKS